MCALWFWTGFKACYLLSYIPPKPIIKTVVKEVKVYDFSQEPKIMEYYANEQGKSLISLEEIKKEKERFYKQIEKDKTDEWIRGYKAGYTDRIANNF